MLNILLMSFRETLEGALIVMVIISILIRNNMQEKQKYVYYGVTIGVILSIVIGLLVNYAFNYTEMLGEISSMIFEALASLTAGILILIFVIFIIKNRSKIFSDLNETYSNDKGGIFICALVIMTVVREGFELVLFIVASPDRTNVTLPIILGVLLALVLSFLVSKSIVKIRLETILKVTLVFLILQIGYIIGYAVHEFIEILEIKEIYLDSTLIHGRLYDLNDTFLNSKEAILGIILNGFVGWYSKPHILQFIVQYTITVSLLLYMKYSNKK